MRCEQVQEWLGCYEDLPETDMNRLQVNEHIQDCPACTEELRIWQESAALIRMVQEEPEPVLYTSPPMADQVMKRIYASESWRIPVSNRIYAIPAKLRRNLSIVISACLLLFMFAFVHTLVGSQPTDYQSADNYGFQQTGKASSDAASSLNVQSMSRTTLASVGPTIIDPVKIGPIRTVPDYFLALSILGMISTLLIMNWLSRTRA